MHQCCVLGCKNQANHSFPRDVNLRKLWEAAIRRKTKTSSKICNLHFKSEDFIEVGKYSGLYNTRRILKKGIVPSVFHWTKTQDIKSKKRRKRADAQDPLAVPEPVKLETPEHVVPTFSQLTAPKEVPIEPFVPEGDDYRCKDCAADIDGFSWWCVQCSCGALCGACALRAHDEHYVLRAPQGATRSQTQAVLAVIRQQLQDENLLALYDVDKLGVKLEIKLEPVDPPSPLPEPVLDAMLETALDTEPDPVLDVKLDPEPAFDTLVETTLDPVMESDPLSTESDDAGNEVAEMNEDKELEEYLAKRQRYMETIKPYYNKISTDPEPSLDSVLDTTLDPALDTVDLTMEADPLTTEPEDAGKEVSENEDKKLAEYLAKRQRFMETITPYDKKKIFRYNPRSPDCLKTMPNEETALKDNPRGSQTLQTPVFLHLYSSSNLEGSQNLQAPSNPTGSQTQQAPSNIKRVETLQNPSNLRGSQTVRVPSSLRGSQTVRDLSSLGGSQIVRDPSSLGGSQIVQVPSSLRGSQTERAPSNLRGSQTQHTPSNLRGSQTVRVPSSLRGSQTVRSPSNIRGSQTQQTPSKLKRSQTLQTPSTPGGSGLTVLKVMPSELITSTAKTSPGSSQTVSKQKIKRTIFKVPINELGKPKTIHFSDSSLKSIRKVRPSELLKLKKVQNVLKNTDVLTEQNDSKELKLRNILKGCSIPLKVTSGPPRDKH